jgi:DNA polymerase-1
MVLQVHDELVFESAEGMADSVASAVRAEMEGVAELAVPLRVDVHTGRNWAEAH